ncbi:MAG: hypothetical protein ALAOOOJD_03085 [bacterium]|nr:hypothetical protein [bacterium]
MADKPDSRDYCHQQEDKRESKNRKTILEAS